HGREPPHQPRRPPAAHREDPPAAPDGRAHDRDLAPAAGTLPALLRHGQGQDLLLDAVAAVPPSVALTVVLLGDGPLRPWLLSRVESDEVLAARVHFEPRAPHDPARDVIGSADLFLHTARSGALPLPLIRAVAL